LFLVNLNFKTEIDALDKRTIDVFDFSDERVDLILWLAFVVDRLVAEVV